MVFSEDETDRLDYQLMQNGSVLLFWRKAIFLDTIEALRSLDYDIRHVAFTSMEKFQDDISDALKWQQQFGYNKWSGNLDALTDGFRGEPFDAGNRAAFCIENFHQLKTEDPKLAWALLDILEHSSRDYLMFGKRLIGLIQTDDDRYSPEPLGGRKPQWNRAEWLNGNRG